MGFAVASCEDCVFYTAIDQTKGTCRRHAPRPESTDGQHPYRERKPTATPVQAPVVLETYNCGDGEAAS